MIQRDKISVYNLLKYHYQLMRKKSEDLSITYKIQTLFNITLPDNQIDLPQNIQNLTQIYLQNSSNSKITSFIIQKLYHFLHLCHNQQIIKSYSLFCNHHHIKFPIKTISKFHPNSLLPKLQSVGITLKSHTNKFQFPHIPPVPPELQTTLDKIFNLNGYFPHYQRLLLFFPLYLHKFSLLYDFLMENQNCLEQSVVYFLSIVAVAQYGSVYMLKRLIKRFIDIGGDYQWLEGRYPLKIKKILPIGHKLAYSPWDVAKNDFKSIMGGDKDSWTEQQLIFACTIMNFHHMTATFALANGLNSQIDGQVCQLNLKFIDDLLSSDANQQKVSNEESSKANIDKVFQNLKTKSERLNEVQQNEIRILQLRLSDNSKQQENSYTKQINEQMKRLQKFELIHKCLKQILPPYKKISRRNQQTTSIIEYSQYNFQFNAYPYLNNFNQQLANYSLNMIEYCKQMTYGNFGDHKINTSPFRRAIRYYVQNLAGYTHLEYKYKENMTNFLSKQLKFYIKLLIYQPFLMRKVVINNIPHQQNIIGYFDIIHSSLLVINTKFEYSMMMVCKALQFINS